eukprot:6294090-Amphidinium_carterae.2
MGGEKRVAPVRWHSAIWQVRWLDPEEGSGQTVLHLVQHFPPGREDNHNAPPCESSAALTLSATLRPSG